MDLPSTFEFKGWNIRYGIATSNDSRVSGSDQKETKCVVFVHGTPWSSIVYQPIVEALLAKQSFKILVYDLPGYGQSQAFNSNISSAPKNGFPDDTSVKFQAEALVALLQHVGFDGKDGHPTPAVIAHDIAGTIVLRAHLIHRCDFDSMMLMDTNTILPWGDGFYKLVRSEPATFLKLPPKIYEAMLRAVIQSACHDPHVLKSGWEDALAQPWIDGSVTNGAQRNFVRQIAQANDEDVHEMLEKDMYKDVRCDVKVISGEQDQWIPREKVETLIRKLGERAKEWTFIPEAGHLVMLDQPARVAVEVFDWLTRFGSEKSLVP
jgi:pimeloyl-ACP methyl ester carboxylesterase